ncbi:MAG: ATP-binding protein [Bacteroidales bacterium]|nr:ATP-binding protein [Bacteroidales bacterium]
MIEEIKIESKLSNLKRAEEFIESVASKMQISREAYGKIIVSVMEAVNNAIIHGNREHTEKLVTITFKKENDAIVVLVADEGSGFIPESIPDPTTPENIESIRGRGVFLMSRLSDKIEFNESGNSVKMSFNSVKA